MACGLVFVIIGMVVSGIGIFIYKINIKRSVPFLDPDQYWGPGQKPENDDISIKDFEIDISQEEMYDLKWRLEHTRQLQPPLEETAQEYGMNSNLLMEIIEFWKTQYDWKKRETFLNKFPQYKTKIQGLDIHYIHVKPVNPDNKKVVPLLILHGWPGSVREFYDVIPIFTNAREDQDFVFEVIAPSIPGYGFSQAASKPGMSAAHIAVIMNNLMKRLGFATFYCQGGDFGAIILQNLCVLYPECVLGFHTNMAYVATPLSYIKYLLCSIWPSLIVKPDHIDRVYPLWDKAVQRIKETGYLHLQATKPDTLGVAMTDSPAGLAAYILEKFTTGTNRRWQSRPDGGLLKKFSYTDLLDNVMIYWWTRTATSSFRLYAETFSIKGRELKTLTYPLDVLTAIARYRNDFYMADGILGEIYPKLLQISDLEGGHFAAFELPEVFANDVFAAVQKFENFNKLSEKKYE